MTGAPTDPVPERVRVTGPPRRHAPRSRSGDLAAQSALGEVYVQSLLRAQLQAAVRIGMLLALTVGLLPLAFHVFPEAFDAALLGVPLAWWALGLGVYPLFLLLGWRYVVRAERNERDFADLIDDP